MTFSPQSSADTSCPAGYHRLGDTTPLRERLCFKALDTPMNFTVRKLFRAHPFMSGLLITLVATGNGANKVETEFLG